MVSHEQDLSTLCPNFYVLLPGLVHQLLQCLLVGLLRMLIWLYFFMHEHCISELAN
jgi:hypothetical protein